MKATTWVRGYGRAKKEIECELSGVSASGEPGDFSSISMTIKQDDGDPAPRMKLSMTVREARDLAERILRFTDPK